MRKFLLTLFLTVAWATFASQADAANCFWVGGTGNLNDTTHWASATGGTASSCPAVGGFPNSTADNATFDGSSGGGTVTDNVAGWTVNNFTMSAFTGTFDDATNNNNITIAGSFVSNGSGTRTLNCGTGTWTFISDSVAVWNTQGATAFTEACTNVTLKMQPASLAASMGITPFTNESLGNISLVWPGSSPSFGFYFNLSTGMTIKSLTTSGPVSLIITPSATLTITNAPTLAGTQSQLIPLQTWRLDQTLQATITVTNTAGQSYSWMAFKNIAFTNAITANNSYNFGNNSGITINAPAAGGGAAAIIGGF